MEKLESGKRYFAILRTGIRIARFYLQTTLLGADLLTTSLSLQACMRSFRGCVSKTPDEIWGFAGLVGRSQERESAEGASGWVKWCC
jgi:hypothetical protein